MIEKSRRPEREISSGEIYTAKELAEILQISQQTIYNKISLGQKLPRHFRVGNRVRFQGYEVIKFIEEQKP